MRPRHWLTAACALVLLAGLVVGTPAPATLAGAPASEQYRLVASEVGSPPVAMQSASYDLNEGVVLQAEAEPAMESETYRVSGIVPYRVYLPIVVRGS